MAYTIVTGAAGFIGSNLVRALNERGIKDVIAVDNLEHAGKFPNLVDCELADYFDKRSFLERLAEGAFDGAVDGVLHQGACSDTMESDGRYMMENNYRYSLALLDWCAEEGVPFLYASSAAVYGAGPEFREERRFERPLNVYGYSKFLFDQIVRRRLGEAGTQIAGFRYFNVYGPRETHKGRMASVALHNFNEYREHGRVRLFGAHAGYAAGEQKRDFVSVEDVIAVNLYFLENPDLSGIFNLGTGRAQPFNDVALAAINASRAADGKARVDLGTAVAQGLIEYIDFPEALKGKYQSFTQADINALREAGYDREFLSVEAGVERYFQAWAGTR
ncbi:MAG: ADP-glyceromanno-heptose 6-epimerase [Burkholderiales bacterium]|nr:ADP-glyceromanno-heptose 6-epimerase [Burkholderiales bacterium]